MIEIFLERFMTGVVLLVILIAIAVFIQSLMDENETSWIILSIVSGVVICYLFGWAVQSILFK